MTRGGWHLAATGPARNRSYESTWTGYQLHCAYCCEPFTTRRSNVECCSADCAARHAAWNRWIRETRAAAVYGRRGPAYPAGGASLAAVVSRYAVQLDLVGVAS